MWSIGVESGTAMHSLCSEVGQANGACLEMAEKEQNIKGIEDYPCPLAVVGVSVL